MKAVVNIALWIAITLLTNIAACAVLVGCLLVMPESLARIQVITGYALVALMTEKTIRILTISLLILAALVPLCGILRFAIAVREKWRP